MKIFNTKSLFLLLVILFVNNYGFAQPILDWSENYGGFNSDVARDIEKTTDGGYIMVGRSESNNEDVSGNNGGQDARVGKKLWWF